MKKIVYVLMISLLLLQAACSKDAGKGGVSDEEALANLNESGMPIVKEPITLKMLAGMSKTTMSNWDDILIWNTYEEMTNIKVEWEQIPGDALEEKRNLALAGGNLPDVFYAANLPTLDIYKYGQEGVFLKLNDLIDKHAPNLKKLMEKNPEIKKAITFPDGNIYSLPVVYDPEFTSVRTHPLPWFKQEVLDEVGMDVPETTEELYQFLKAVKDKTDLVPYGSWNIEGLITWLRGAYGIATTGVSYIDKDPESGDIRFYVTTDRYKEMLEFLNKLYSEGLIEQNIFTIDWGQFLNKGTEGGYASMMFYAPTELFGQEAGEKYVVGLPLEGPHGDRKFAQLAHPVAHAGKFAVTNTNPNPAATIRWVDHFYSDEGARLFYMGVEGETYEVADGKYKYLDKITNSTEGLSKEQEIVKYLGWIGMGAPGILMEQYFDGSEASEQSLDGAEKVKPYLIDEVWPPFTYTEEEAKKLSALSADIEKYVLEMRDKFIVGETPFSEWDNYVKNLEKMGLEKYMEIQKEAFDRYQKN